MSERPMTVYSMTNLGDNNQVAAFGQRGDGRLELRALYPTGGDGTGGREVSPATPEDGIDPLASQGSLALSRDGRFLFAVNAGSGSVSSFRVGGDGTLALADVEPSGGAQPNALDSFGNTLYVANVGDRDDGFRSNITGLRIHNDGRLSRIPGATYALSTPNAQPARVLFCPQGKWLVVCELTTDRLTTFAVSPDGMLGARMVSQSCGAGPFGSWFLSNGNLLVAEAGANALSSYLLGPDGSLRAISPSVPTGQYATCWVTMSRDEKYAYVSNTASGTITIFHVHGNGTVDFVRNVPVGARARLAAPTDSGVSADDKYLYVLDGGRGAVSVLRIHGKAEPDFVQTAPGLPRLGAQGLAVR